MPLVVVRFPALGPTLLPPDAESIGWQADHNCMFLPGELYSNRGSFARKFLEGFVSALKAPSNENGVAKAQFPYLKGEEGWRAIYAQQLPVGPGWKHPLASSLSCPASL